MSEPLAAGAYWAKPMPGGHMLMESEAGACGLLHSQPAKDDLEPQTPTTPCGPGSLSAYIAVPDGWAAAGQPLAATRSHRQHRKEGAEPLLLLQQASEMCVRPQMHSRLRPMTKSVETQLQGVGGGQGETLGTAANAGRGVRGGKWSHEEHEAFLRAYTRFGRSWKDIALLVPTRTSEQIRTHAQKFFAKHEKAKRLKSEAGPHSEALECAPPLPHAPFPSHPLTALPPPPLSLSSQPRFASGPQSSTSSCKRPLDAWQPPSPLKIRSVSEGTGVSCSSAGYKSYALSILIRELEDAKPVLEEEEEEEEGSERQEGERQVDVGVGTKALYMLPLPAGEGALEQMVRVAREMAREEEGDGESMYDSCSSGGWSCGRMDDAMDESDDDDLVVVMAMQPRRGRSADSKAPMSPSSPAATAAAAAGATVGKPTYYQDRDADDMDVVEDVGACAGRGKGGASTSAVQLEKGHDGSAHEAASAPRDGNNSKSQLREGRWTRDEHQLFLRAYKTHGKSWKEISNIVRTRSAEQIRTHAQKFFAKESRTKQQSKGSDSLPSPSSNAGAAAKPSTTNPTAAAGSSHRRTEGRAKPAHSSSSASSSSSGPIPSPLSIASSSSSLFDVDMPDSVSPRPTSRQHARAGVACVSKPEGTSSPPAQADNGGASAFSTAPAADHASPQQQQQHSSPSSSPQLPPPAAPRRAGSALGLSAPLSAADMMAPIVMRGYDGSTSPGAGSRDTHTTGESSSEYETDEDGDGEETESSGDEEYVYHRRLSKQKKQQQDKAQGLHGGSAKPLRPGQNEGRWTREEHSKFLEGLRLYGKSWRDIQTVVTTRTPDQIRTHAQKHFIKIAKHGPGTCGLSATAGASKPPSLNSGTSSSSEGTVPPLSITARARVAL